MISFLYTVNLALSLRIISRVMVVIFTEKHNSLIRCIFVSRQISNWYILTSDESHQQFYAGPKLKLFKCTEMNVLNIHIRHVILMNNHSFLNNNGRTPLHRQAVQTRLREPLYSLYVPVVESGHNSIKIKRNNKKLVILWQSL